MWGYLIVIETRIIVVKNITDIPMNNHKKFSDAHYLRLLR